MKPERPVSTRGASQHLLALAALPHSAERTAEMLHLQALIEKSEQRVSPAIVQLIDEMGSAKVKTSTGNSALVPSVAHDKGMRDGVETPDPFLVERNLSDNVLMPFVRYLLDADGRGSFNVEAIAARVAALAWMLDPALVFGASERKLAAELGICREKLSRAVRAVCDDLHLSNASTGEFQRAAKKSARRFAAITRSKKSHSTPKAA